MSDHEDGAAIGSIATWTDGDGIERRGVVVVVLTDATHRANCGNRRTVHVRGDDGVYHANVPVGLCTFRKAEEA